MIKSMKTMLQTSMMCIFFLLGTVALDAKVPGVETPRIHMKPSPSELTALRNYKKVGSKESSLRAIHGKVHRKTEEIRADEPIEFAIVIPSYNNEKWCQRNLNSVFNQSYPYWHIYYINDFSKDRTGELVDSIVQQEGLEHKCTIIHNKERRGKLTNFYDVINKVPPHKIVVEIDGDDWLAHPQVLETLAAVYSNKNVWLTYGEFVHYPGYRKGFCAKFPDDVIRKAGYRDYQKYITHHLRTFYAKLFQKIKKDDLVINGFFFPMAGDLAYMFPMLEMASEGHFRMIPRVLYVYNIGNPINDYKVNRAFQVRLDRLIRSLPRYTPLDTLF